MALAALPLNGFQHLTEDGLVRPHPLQITLAESDDICHHLKHNFLRFEKNCNVYLSDGLESSNHASRTCIASSRP